jgi:hypothetical protein
LCRKAKERDEKKTLLLARFRSSLEYRKSSKNTFFPVWKKIFKAFHS